MLDKQNQTEYEFCETVREYKCSREIESNQWKQVNQHNLYKYTLNTVIMYVRTVYRTT